MYAVFGCLVGSYRCTLYWTRTVNRFILGSSVCVQSVFTDFVGLFALFTGLCVLGLGLGLGLGLAEECVLLIPGLRP